MNFTLRSLGYTALLLALADLAPAKISAQQPHTVPLYADSIPNSRPTSNEERSEVTKDGVLIISKVSRPALTIYSPPAGKVNGTAVVICPGGGYWVEAADLEGTDFAKRFAAEGVTGIVLKYRLPSDETMVDRSIGALQDAQQAIKVVREHAVEWGIDPGRIGIMGFSAGGHLAAMAATHFDRVMIPDDTHVSVRPDFLILGYPVITCSDSSRHAGSCEMLLGKHPTAERLREYSNELQVTDSTPPTFLVHASDDTGVSPENSILFYQALLRHHVPAELHLYQYSGHGFGMHLKHTREDWMGRCLHWMEANGWIPRAAPDTGRGGPAGTGDVPPSEDYTVNIGGRPAFVYASPIPASFCSFPLERPVTVRITTTQDVKWVDVRPLSAGVRPVFHDGVIELRLVRPVMLSIEVNGSRKRPLFLFANAPETDAPMRGGAGIIRFDSARVYHAGIIHVKSNQTVYIAAGAIVEGVILAEHARHVRICGRGILDGTTNNDFVSAEGRGYRRAIECRDCRDVTIEGITLYNTTSWEIVPIHCGSVRIRGVRIISDHDSDDGIDVVRSTHVEITGCFIRTKDDCIAIKSNFDYPVSAGVDGVLVSRCVFWNGAWGNALEIGFELNSAYVRNVVFRNNDIIHVEDGAAISIHNAGRAVVEKVRYEDIRIEDATQKLLDLAIIRSRYSDDGATNAAEAKRLYFHGAWDGVLRVPAGDSAAHANYRGSIRDIRFTGIRIVDGLFPYSIFCGYDERHRISNVNISGLWIHGRRLRTPAEGHFFCRSVVGLRVD